MNAVYHWIGVIVFWGAAFVATLYVALYVAGFIWHMAKKVYHRTWLHAAIDAIRFWYRYDFRKEKIENLRYALLLRKALTERKGRFKVFPLRQWYLSFLNRHIASDCDPEAAASIQEDIEKSYA